MVSWWFQGGIEVNEFPQIRLILEAKIGIKPLELFNPLTASVPHHIETSQLLCIGWPESLFK